MGRINVDRLELWRTKLKVKQEYIVDDQIGMVRGNATWFVTDFVRRVNSSDLEYVVQPLVNEGEINEGVTGLDAYVLTEKQLVKYFEVK